LITRTWGEIAPTDEDLRTGALVDEYRLIELLGSGGEAVIWAAWETRRERVVALKLLRAKAGETGDVSQTFERQVHLLASLDHPHILPLYSFGSTETHYYFVMQYNPVGSLQDALRGGPLPLDVTLDMARQITSALVYLHGLNIVHRDLKPGNILLDTQSRAYLADFGLARQLSLETALLHTGRGTLAYVSPEQKVGAQVTPRSDLYSLGILIYEMLTGDLPWSGEKTLATEQLQAENVVLPDPHDANPAIPAGITDLLRRLTAYRADDRPLMTDYVYEKIIDLLAGVAKAGTALAAAPRDPWAVKAVSAEKRIAADARNLMTLALDGWTPGREPRRSLSPGQFIFVHSAAVAEGDGRLSVTREGAALMLYHALIHGHHMGHWWQRNPDPVARLRVCEGVIKGRNEAAAGRAARQLLGEPVDALPPGALAPATVERLIDLALHSAKGELRRSALELAGRLAPAPSAWQPITISPKADRLLARIALDDSELAGRATRLIARLRSESAVEAMLEEGQRAGRGPLLAALRAVRAEAGDLPGVVPLRLRGRMLVEALRENVVEDRAAVSWTRALIGLAAGGLIALTMAAGGLMEPNLRTRDALLQPYEPSGVVTIVGVDDASLAAFGRWDSWSRSLHADLIRRLDEAGADVIVFDFAFISETPDDATLAAAMREAGDVLQPIIAQGDARITEAGVWGFEAGLPPTETLRRASAGVGNTNLLHDPDGLVRRIPIVAAIGDEMYPNLALAAVQVYLGGSPEASAPTQGAVPAAGRSIPVEAGGAMRIHYAGPPTGPGGSTFPVISYRDVIEGTAPADAFENRIVLVGMMATAEPDRYLTAVSRGRPMYGVEVLANTVETIWSGRFLSVTAGWVRIAILLALGVTAGLLTTRPVTGLALSGGLGALYFLVASWLLDRYGVMVDLLYPFAAIGLTYAAVTAYRFAVEVRRRREVMGVFEASVTPEIARATLAAIRRGHVNLGGQVQEVSAVFADIRGYTAYAEAYEPEDVMEMVNRFLGLAVGAIFEEEGTVVHYEGDEVMAIFNAPLEQPDHPRRAIRAALRIRERVNAYHKSLPPSHPHRRIEFGCGVYTGRAVVGYTGTAQRYTYTALGDAINVAARLTEAAEPGQVLAGEATYNRATDVAEAVPLPPLTVRGRSALVAVFAVKNEGRSEG
jgi:adenylate cyclase